MIGIGGVVNGKYRVVRALGDGGMGAVFEAQHAMLGTRVAIKALHPELERRPGLVERFLQEARVVAQIRSPNVVQVIDIDRTAEGHAFIVMELLEGEPLSGILDRQRRLPVALAREYTLQILSALEAAHTLGVVHRDLKPENVIVTHVAGGPVLKLIDFGIAKARPSDPSQRSLTVAGAVMGTAEYMAPEQARSAESVDARADVYAAGVMLYEMLAGVRPVRGDGREDAREIALKVERGDVVPLVQAAPETPRELASLVHHAMAARPDMRFASAAEMRTALAALKEPAGGRIEAGPPAPPVAFAAHTAAAPTPPSAPPEEPRIDTVRAPPIAAALAAPYPDAAPPIPPGAAPSPRRSRPGGPAGAKTAAVFGIAGLFGASVVGILVGTGTMRSSAVPAAPPPLASAPSGSLDAPAPAAAATAYQAPIQADVPALAPAKPVSPGRPASSGRAIAVAVADAGPARPSLSQGGGFPGFPGVVLPPGFPTALPSGFPVALPSSVSAALSSAIPVPAWPQPSAPARDAPGY